MPQITDKDRQAVAQSIKHAKLIETSRRLARIVRHEDPSPQRKAKRTRLERDLVAWLKFFLPETYPDAWSPDHETVLGKTEKAIRAGGLFAEAMPRGHGKSTIVKGAVLFAVMTGLRRYVVSIAATAELAEAIIDFVRRQIMESDKLHEYYPHVTAYARATEGKAIRARFQLRADGKASGIEWSKNTLVLPEVTDAAGKPYPSNGAILEAHGLTGAIRGKWKDTKTGQVIRPDFVILDDPQTRESAESMSQCDQRERIITGDVLGLAGPRKRIAAIMPCTIIRKGDLAARFLDRTQHPEWQGEVFPLVKKWPAAQDTLWREYAERYQAGVREGRGFDAATQFYRENRAAMDDGAEVSWKERVRNGELSALQTAENLLIETGPQFWAEFQNAPLDHEATIYDLTPPVILSRSTDRAPGAVPDWVRVRVAGTDINPSYGLTWALVGFGADQTAAVLGYGVHPMSVPPGATEVETNRAIYEALVQHGRKLAALPCRPEAWFVDAGGSAFDVACRFGAESARVCGVPATPATGRGARNYRPGGKTLVGAPREQCHLAMDQHRRKWVAWNADYWREVAQKAWTGSIGAPGSCSLPAGNHREFAEQICREQLAGKGEVGGQMVWTWHTQPGRHDYGDAVSMCYMGAAFSGGIGAGGRAAMAPRAFARARVRHIKV